MATQHSNTSPVEQTLKIPPGDLPGSTVNGKPQTLDYDLSELQGPTLVAADNEAVPALKAAEVAEEINHLLSAQDQFTIGKYQILRELGRGTCGIVYQGHDTLVKRDVAIKVAWTDKDNKLDFFTEAHTAGKLQHPNIVTVYDAQTEHHLNYIVMELVHGKTLLNYCRPKGRHLSDQDILQCMFKCCQALDYSHSLNVIHRDIKPSNIMLTDNGVTKIMDFSVAQVMQGGGLNGGLLVGSPTYMSPEQILRKDVGPSTDLYALAAVMYQLLTRKRLYDCKEVKQTFRKILHEAPPKLFDSRPDLPKALSELIDRALSKRIEDRYQSGAEMAADLSTIYDNLMYAENQAKYGEAVEAVRYLPFFQQFDKSQINRLMMASSLLNFTVGQYISQESHIDNAFYILVKGQVRVLQGRKVITTLHSGHCYGDVADQWSKTAADEPDSSSLVALSRTVVLKIDAVRIESLPVETQLLFYKAFSHHMIQRLSKRNPKT